MRRAPIEAARAGLATDGGTSAAHGVGEAGVDGREDNGEEELDWRHRQMMDCAVLR